MSYRPETLSVHAGQSPDEQTGAVIPPIYATSTFAQISPGVTRGYDYTRSGNPNFTRLERALCALENAGFATVFSSGMAAVTAVLSTLSSGDVVIAEENIYGCTYRIFDTVFETFGVRVDYLDFTREEQVAQIAGRSPALIWIESPTNPLLKIIDIRAIAAIAESCGADLIVDNTFASPYFQKPLELGATLSLTSTTKYVNGHSDCLGGAVTTNTESWHERLVFAQKAVGLNPSPFDAWLIARGLKTLPLRMRQHHKNALAFARQLEHHAAVTWCRYPFLPSHPHYDLATSQMTGGSGIVTADFDLSLDDTKTLVSTLRIFALAESLGGVESLICHPASMTHAAVPEEQRRRVGITDGLVRFSIGIEDVEDLLDDFDHAWSSLSR